MTKPHRSTSWDELGWSESPRGVRASRFTIGAGPDAPTVFQIHFPPGCRVEAHTHDNDYCEVILEGSQQVGSTWHHAGDIRIATAGTGYGPLTAGPEGCRVLIIFTEGRWSPIPLAAAAASRS